MADLAFFWGVLEFVLCMGGALAFLTLHRSAPSEALGLGLSSSLVFSALSLTELVHGYSLQTFPEASRWFEEVYKGLITLGASALFGRTAAVLVRRVFLTDRGRWVVAVAAALPWIGFLLSTVPIGSWGPPERAWERWLSAEAALFLLGALLFLVARPQEFLGGRIRGLGVAACALALPVVFGEVFSSPAGAVGIYAFQGERGWFLVIQGLALAAAIRRIARPPLSGDSVRTAEVVRKFRLSETETELLLLIADAQTNKTIAQNLEVSEETVKRQVSRLLKKTGTQSRSQLMGLVPAVAP